MISFIYCDSDGAVSLKIDDTRLLDRFERDIISEIKMAATEEKLERTADLIRLAMDFNEAMNERKRLLAMKEKEEAE